jgi:hypothetical protein
MRTRSVFSGGGPDERAFRGSAFLGRFGGARRRSASSRHVHGGRAGLALRGLRRRQALPSGIRDSREAHAEKNVASPGGVPRPFSAHNSMHKIADCGQNRPVCSRWGRLDRREPELAKMPTYYIMDLVRGGGGGAGWLKRGAPRRHRAEVRLRLAHRRRRWAVDAAEIRPTVVPGGLHGIAGGPRGERTRISWSRGRHHEGAPRSLSRAQGLWEVHSPRPARLSPDAGGSPSLNAGCRPGGRGGHW